jgi:hypothetical protein
MIRFRQSFSVFSALALVLGYCGVASAQKCGSSSSVRTLVLTQAPLQASLNLTPAMLQHAKVYSYQQIRAQTLADNSPDAAEVHTYLRNPVQWQKNMNKDKSYELGLPRSRVILADGTIIRTYVRPQLTQGWQYHLFTDPPPKGFVQFWIYAPGYLYQIQTPPGSPLAQRLQATGQIVTRQ